MNHRPHPQGAARATYLVALMVAALMLLAWLLVGIGSRQQQAGPGQDPVTLTHAEEDRVLQPIESSDRQHRRLLELALASGPDAVTLDLLHQQWREDPALPRQQRLALLWEQLSRLEPGGDAYVASLYTLASEIPLELLPELIKAYRLSEHPSSRDLLLQVMRIATQEPMLGALARQFPQGPDALYLLARQHTADFQSFVIEQNLHLSEPGLAADLIWTRAMLVEPDQGLRVIQQSIDELQLKDPAALRAAGQPTSLHDATAQIYLDLLLADATLASLLAPQALAWVERRDDWFQDALASEWQRRIDQARQDGDWVGESLRPIWLVVPE